MKINWRRWGIRPTGLDIGADGDPYLDRLRLIETPLFAVFLHHIHRPDKDPDPHDHPWWFWSVVLAGSYIERGRTDKRDPRALGWIRVHKPFVPFFLSRRSAHIIEHIKGPLWTLVITGPSYGTDSWGFWPGGKFVLWREYISANGHDEYAAAKAAEDGTAT